MYKKGFFGVMFKFTNFLKSYFLILLIFLILSLTTQNFIHGCFFIILILGSFQALEDISVGLMSEIRKM